jgi:capsular polysaccharide transport system permease protein
MNAVQGNAALLTFPMITPMDCVVARFLLETLTMTLVITVLYAGLWASGELAAPPALLPLIAGFAAAALFGGALGGLAAVLISLAPTIERLLPVLRRPLYFISGVFFIPAIVPEPVRQILLGNPLMHAIDWVRAGTYGAYRAPHLDRAFLGTSLLVLVFLAFALERAVRTPWRG